MAYSWVRLPPHAALSMPLMHMIHFPLAFSACPLDQYGLHSMAGWTEVAQKDILSLQSSHHSYNLPQMQFESPSSISKVPLLKNWCTWDTSNPFFIWEGLTQGTCYRIVLVQTSLNYSFFKKKTPSWEY